MLRVVEGQEEPGVLVVYNLPFKLHFTLYLREPGKAFHTYVCPCHGHAGYFHLLMLVLIMFTTQGGALLQQLAMLVIPHCRAIPPVLSVDTCCHERNGGAVLPGGTGTPLDLG